MRDERADETHAMHVPPAYAADAGALRAWIAARPFAQLVGTGPAGLLSTATPLIFAGDGPDESVSVLVGHMARRNPHAAWLDGPALAIFAGPNAYVSPRWYLEGPDLPTWNYVGVQVRGSVQALDGDAEARAVLERTIAVMERQRPDPWRLDEADPTRVAALLPHIRAFRFRVERMEGAMKLSQNKPGTERQNVIAGLEASGMPGSAEVAALMRAAD